MKWKKETGRWMGTEASERFCVFLLRNGMVKTALHHRTLLFSAVKEKKVPIAHFLSYSSFLILQTEGCLPHVSKWLASAVVVELPAGKGEEVMFWYLPKMLSKGWRRGEQLLSTPNKQGGEYQNNIISDTKKGPLIEQQEKEKGVL